MLKKFIQNHPLLFCLTIAITLRFFAVIFSKGYMAHDDHFETVRMAYLWFSGDMFRSDGTLTWIGAPASGISRSTFYPLLLFWGMKFFSIFGGSNLNSFMYFNRALHALFSLVLVTFGFKYVQMESDKKTATICGLILAGHFLFPFLSVRNLIEMVSSELLLPSLFLSHLGLKQNKDVYHFYAGLLMGLAWVIRPHVLVAMLPIPFLILLVKRKLQPLLFYLFSFSIIVMAQGILDIFTVGRFLGSQIDYVMGNFSQPPCISGPIYQYLLLSLGVFIPPFSLVFLGSIFQKDLIRNNLIVFSATMSFLVIHSLVPAKQERFLLPIFPELVILGCLGLFYLCQSRAWYLKKGGLRRSLLGFSIAVSVLLLIPTTLNYSHRDRVEPLVFLSRQKDVKGVIFDCTEKDIFIPDSYLGPKRPSYFQITKWKQLGAIPQKEHPNYAVIFSEGGLEEHILNLEKQMRGVAVIKHIHASLIDRALHLLNPKHNQTDQAWILKQDANLQQDPELSRSENPEMKHHSFAKALK